MTDIPDEVMEEARRLLDDIIVTDGIGNLEEMVARYLLARDKRAAEIARAMPKMISMSPAHVRGLTGDDVAEAILTYRTGQEEGK